MTAVKKRKTPTTRTRKRTVAKVKKVAQFDRPTSVALNAEIRTAVEAIAKKHGLKLTAGGCRWLSVEFTTKLKLTVIDAKTGVDQAAKQRWERGCGRFDLKAEWFGGTFVSNGKRFTIADLKTRARRYPVIAVTDDGKRYKFNAQSVRVLLAFGS